LKPHLLSPRRSGFFFPFFFSLCSDEKASRVHISVGAGWKEERKREEEKG